MDRVELKPSRLMPRPVMIDAVRRFLEVSADLPADALFAHLVTSVCPRQGRLRDRGLAHGGVL
jgi:hypothetical protein